MGFDPNCSRLLSYRDAMTDRDCVEDVDFSSKEGSTVEVVRLCSPFSPFSDVFGTEEEELRSFSVAKKFLEIVMRRVKNLPIFRIWGKDVTIFVFANLFSTQVTVFSCDRSYSRTKDDFLCV